MIYLKKYKTFLKYFKIIPFILILSLILTIVNLIIPLSTTINSLISLIAILLYSFIIGIKTGFKAPEKSLLASFKTGLINILILYIVSIIFLSFTISIKRIVYYLLIIISTLLCSIIGISKKR